MSSIAEVTVMKLMPLIVCLSAAQWVADGASRVRVHSTDDKIGCSLTTDVLFGAVKLFSSSENAADVMAFETQHKYSL